MSNPARAPDDERAQATDAKRYIQLLEKVLDREHTDLPKLVQSAFVDRDGVSFDTLQFVGQKNEELVSLKQKLVEADKEYARLREKCASLDLPDEPVDVNSRIVDFVWGLVTSVERDFTKRPDLQLLSNELLKLSRNKKS